MKKGTGKIIKSAMILLLIMGAVFLFLENYKRSEDYKKAMNSVGSGRLEDAYELFKSLGKYKDSASQVDKLLALDPLLPIRPAQKGDLVSFGRYEQDNKTENGPEPIRWLVLDRIENQLLLLSLYGLDGKPYHAVSFSDITWEGCTLRSWLNNDFLMTSFTETEQSFIPSVQNGNRDQSAVGTYGGADTADRVFLLSETDSLIYLNNDIDRESIGKAQATEYAVLHSVETDEEGYVSWWLRSPGVYPYSAQFVNQDGELHLSGAYVDIDYQFAVRPAIWLDLGK